MPCNCGDVTSPIGGLSRLGQGTSMQIQAIETAVQTLVGFVAQAKQLWDQLVSELGIHAGQREADAIVPLQNNVHLSVLAPVSDMLTQYKAGTIQPTCQDFARWLTIVKTAEAKWLGFLHNTQWQDGRAAVQAENTLAPYFTNAERDLTTFSAGCGGIGGGIITNPDGSFNWPVLLLGGGAILFLATRKR